MPKIVDHEKRRIDLVEAAARVIARVGLQQASIRAIAAEAGYSPAAPLHYFGTREKLFEFAFEHFSKQSIDILHRIAECNDEAANRLRDVIDVLLDRSAGDIFFARCVMSMVMGADQSSRIKQIDQETYARTTQLVRELLEETRRDGDLSVEVDCDAEAGLIISVADGLVVAAVTLGDGATHLKEKLLPILLGRLHVQVARPKRLPTPTTS